MNKTFLSALACLALLASPARAGDFSQRQDVADFITEMHERNGFSTAELEADFRLAKRLPAVLKAIRPPANPAIRSWEAYRNRFVEPKRIALGSRFWRQYQAEFATASQRYGVPEEIIAAIIGVETIYGQHMGRFTTFDALATLAFDYPPRAPLFRRELEALLLLAREEQRNVRDYKGSYAGALGLPQFLPSSLRNYAVDFDGDGRIDLAGSPADAIGSVARFLAEHGWQSGQPIWAPARTEGDRIADAIALGIEPKIQPADLAAYGIITDPAPTLPATLVDLISPNAATEYRLGFRNFYVITRYNKSSFYASAVADLATALREARDFR